MPERDGKSVKWVVGVVLAVLLVVEGVVLYRIARDNFDFGGAPLDDSAQGEAVRAPEPEPEPVPVRVAPPPAPPPPILPSGASPARPAENPGRWFSNDDYPAAARRAGQQGRVVIALDVGTDGRVAACRVTQSSGSATLDSATCDLAIARGRYEPARSPDGVAIASTVVLPGIRWQLED